MNSSQIGREARKSLTSAQREEFSQTICKRVQEFIGKNDVVMLYNAIDGEVIVDKIKAKKVILPTIKSDRIVSVEKSDDSILGKYKICEPIGEEFTDKIDIIVVPMCAFDRKMMRSGFGKGYYDKFLADKHALKIGVAFSSQEQKSINRKPTDVLMDVIITEKEIIK